MASIFEVGAPGIDTAKLVEEVQARVTAKAEQGVYADARVARAERTNLVNLRNDQEFMEFFMRCLRETAFVDINDYEIRERRGAVAPLLVALKKVIWKLLKFYTYRLWSQQNSVNGLLVTGLESVDEKYRDRMARLEARIAELEKHAGKPATGG